MASRTQNSRVEATAGVLRDILTILLALAFTGSVAAFLTTDGFVPVDTSDLSTGRLLVFLCVLPTIIRFYHGNVSYLNATYSVSDSEAGLRHYGGKLAVDFMVFLIQAMVFSALALYQSRTHDFFVLFVALFLVDAVWCLINVWFSAWTFRDFEGPRAHQHFRSQMNWMLANSIAAVLIAVPLILRSKGGDPALAEWIPYFFAVVTLNAAIDYWQNRRLYFPPGTIKRTRKVAFVGARFTSAIGPTGFDPHLRRLIDATHEVARSRQLNVLSAHEEEAFGAALAKPDVLVRRDLEQLAESDVFIALWDTEPSPGLLIELGWASALHKRIVLLLPSDFDVSAYPMIKGLPELTICHIARYNGTVPSLEDALQKSLVHIFG